MTKLPSDPQERTKIVRHYHQKTKHHLQAYAEGPGTLDWDQQPNPFRHYAAAPQQILPHTGTRFDRPLEGFAMGENSSVDSNLMSLSALLELAFGVSAWKVWGPNRWAVRNNPSSGNLHPVEATVLCANWPEVPDGVHHYEAQHHHLEQRAVPLTPSSHRWLAIGLSSVQWREAWKYGERAFRYCQLDVGHGVGALTYAAALLGWKLTPFPMTSQQIAHCLGIDRTEDFALHRRLYTEVEEPELLVFVTNADCQPPPPAESLMAWLAGATWHGKPSIVDAEPGYRWPLVEKIAQATRDEQADPIVTSHHWPTLPIPTVIEGGSAVEIIRRRRSAQRFDAKYHWERDDFYRWCERLLARPTPLWQSCPEPFALHLVLFVMRVADLTPGLYYLPRHPHGAEALSDRLARQFPEKSRLTTAIEGCPADLPLERLQTSERGAVQKLSRLLCCHQEIAATSALTVAMIGDYEAATNGSSGYRALLRSAGFVGQHAYLGAEILGMQGTGIGCFFDDAVHDLLGLSDSGFQSLYHFTVGRSMVDQRIETQAAYSIHEEV